MIALLPEGPVFAAFLIGVTVLVVSPGPDTLYVAARSLAQGRAAGLLACVGISCGLMAHITAAALGLAGLFQTWPLAYDVVRYLGVAYLLYLAWDCFAADEDQGGTSSPPLQGAAMIRIFRQALLTNIFNPKVALFFVAYLPQFADPSRGPVGPQIALLGAILVSMGLAYLVAIALTAGMFGERMRAYPGLRRAQRWLLGTTLGGLAVWLAWPERR
jgi:threonine/homoserine/homoserine lactone efflux protein